MKTARLSWLRAPRPGNGAARSPPTRTGRISGLWGTLLMATVMLGVFTGPSWGQSDDTPNLNLGANCTLPDAGARPWANDPQANLISASSNGAITGDGYGNPGVGYHPGQAEFHLFDQLTQDTCNAAIGTGMDVNGVHHAAWFGVIVGLMNNTFHLLAILELCWAAALWVLEKEHLNSLAAEMVKKLMFIGFFYTLLLYGQVWIPAIVNTFLSIGQNVSGTPASTDGIIAQGLAEVDFIFKNKPKITIGNWPTVLPKFALAALVSVGIILGALILAAQLFMALVESYVMLAVGAVFLGLGANSLTKDHVDKTLNYAIAVGVRLLTILLISTLMSESIQATVDSGWSFDPEPLAKLGAVSLMQLMLALRAPEMAAALMAGGSQGAGMTAGTAASVASNVANAGGWAMNQLTKAAGGLNSTAAGGANRLSSPGGTDGGLMGAAVSGLSKAAHGAASAMNKAASRVTGALSKNDNRAGQPAGGAEGAAPGTGPSALSNAGDRTGAGIGSGTSAGIGGGTGSGSSGGSGSGTGSDAATGPTRARGTAPGGSPDAAGGAVVGPSRAPSQSNPAGRRLGGSPTPASQGAGPPALSPGVAPETASLLGDSSSAPASPPPSYRSRAGSAASPSTPTAGGTAANVPGAPRPVAADAQTKPDR